MTILDRQALAVLANENGLGEAYHDYRGEYRQFSDAARHAILLAMGVLPQASPNRNSDPTLMLPPVRVCTHEELYCDLTLERLPPEALIKVSIHTEAGNSWTNDYPARQLATDSDGVYRLPLAADLPLGYHQLIAAVDGFRAECLLVIAPPRCYEPEALQQGQRLWGLSIQLYTLRSSNNWGIGDFADLQAMLLLAAGQGCNTIGLNPLHALRPADAAHISPYSPSHRDFLNVLYIAVPAVAEYGGSQSAQDIVASSKEQLTALQHSKHVDYVGVAKFKLQVLRLLFAEFNRSEVARDTARAMAFRAYVHQQGEPLHLHALYDVLDEYFSAQTGHHWGWRSWPAPFHDAGSADVQVFATQHSMQIDFYMYLQWLAAEQLVATQHLARSCGMTLGLYGDVAVGVDPNGSEVWSNRRLYVENVAVGAPPDPLALKGQDWGIPPQHPVELRNQAYQPFIRMLRANMHAVGALRIDHVMTLCRLWWVPRGMESSEGVYVHYPLDDLMKLVALESVRSQCLVIGEDLGTVPDAMRDAMERFGMYHYKVLFFEKGHDGQFVAPHEYTERALAVVTTHDLPPLKSWWQGDDIQLRAQLHMYPDEATQQQVLREREADRRLLLLAMSRVGLWDWHEHQPLPDYSHTLMRAAYLYAGLSSAALLVIQPEDLQGMTDPVNVPGTSIQHANWQRKLSADLSETLQLPGVQEILSAMNKARCGENPNS
ncbi:MAG: 4-alpha-glucanotransferase [Steroidobacteraceae bacterium]